MNPAALDSRMGGGRYPGHPNAPTPPTSPREISATVILASISNRLVGVRNESSNMVHRLGGFSNDGFGAAISGGEKLSDTTLHSLIDSISHMVDEIEALTQHLSARL